MSVVSLRLPDSLVIELDSRARTLNIPRNEYIRRALELMNKEILRSEKQQQLKKASILVRTQSIDVNREFSEFEDDIQA